MREVGEESQLEGLVMIDALQRLGIDYHFQEEIDVILQKQFIKSTQMGHPQFDHLYEVSTQFRLLRQEGYNVPADVFYNFKDKEGRFKSELSTNMKGLMSLYEATQHRIKGEDILDEAAEFSSQVLRRWMSCLDYHEALLVGDVLKQRDHKCLARFIVKNFLFYNYTTSLNGWLKGLQELAKMDSIIIQSTYQKEILQISQWWKNQGLASELKFIRNQLLKWYIWPMAALDDPSLSEHRVELTKVISFIYVIDDIFDVYGSLEELSLFTEVVNRWELVAIEKVPDCLKNCFKALYDTTNEIARQIHKKHGQNPINALRRSWVSLCNAFLVEAKWFTFGHKPKAEEYLKNGIISTGVHVVLVHMLFLLGDYCQTEESIDLSSANSEIITSTATILRLWDDLGSAKDENQDGYDGSYIEYYMKEHKGSSVESARAQVICMISDAWKRLNRACLSPNPFSSAFAKASMNFARMIPLMYSYDDNHNLSILEEHMKSMLYDNVSE